MGPLGGLDGDFVVGGVEEEGVFLSFKRKMGPNVAGDWKISPEGPN